MLVPLEAEYPITFRRPYATKLGSYLSQQHSVAIIGMKRVGVANFLRFFLHHPEVPKHYLQDKACMFIEISLKDLVEISEYAFWKLMAKRISDAILNHPSIADETKKRARRYFREALQLQDPMVTIDNIKFMCQELVALGITPCIFLINFDRMKHVFTHRFFDNLENVRYATHDQLCFVITSYRPLAELVPESIPANALKLFAKELYLPPIIDPCAVTIFESYQKRFDIDLDDDLEKNLVHLCGGHVQYLQLAVIVLKEQTTLPQTTQELFEVLVNSEEIQFQSEELFNSLTKEEQQAITQSVRESRSKLSRQDYTGYLFKTKLLDPRGDVSNPLLAHYLKRQKTRQSRPDFTKKEHLLFEVLKKHKGLLVERDTIIEYVWPDQVEIGVSDWAIDRLVARVRQKLVERHSLYQIQTVITRGYKLLDI